MLDRIYTAQLQKTIDALYMENYGDFRDHISYKKPYLAITLNDELELYSSCLKVDGVNPFYVTQPEVLLHNILSNTTSKISISEVFTYLTKASWWPTVHFTRSLTQKENSYHSQLKKRLKCIGGLLRMMT